MTAEQNDWVATRTAWLDKQVLSYPEKLQPLVEAPYVRNVLVKLPLLPKVQADFSEFQNRVEKLLDTLPPVEAGKANAFSFYMQELKACKDFIRTNYNLVPKGYYQNKWLLIGIAIGLLYGLLFKKMGLALPFGLVIGLMVGSGKDKKAEQEGRVL